MAFDNHCRIIGYDVALPLLSACREDTSEYVRKSIGNTLKDISKKYPELISKELNSWNLSSEEIKQVHKLASKFVYEGGVGS